MKNPMLFYRLPGTITDIYKGKKLAWQIAAAILTVLIVMSGFDWAYFEATRSIPFGIILPAVALGGILPILLPLALLGLGAARKAAGKGRRLIDTGWALGQAAILGLAVSSAYKAFTGRIPPPEAFRGLSKAAGDALSTVADASHGFQFGFFRGGIFWGWPSSHTAVAFAMGVALFMLLPDKKILRWAGIAWALYVGLAVSMSIHWFSEFAAGAIIGSVIGAAVGKNFLLPSLQK